MTRPRPATPQDIDDLARLHVAAWAETYSGLVPPDEIARYGLGFRTAQWTQALAAGGTRIALIPGLGFAQAGPQRDAPLAALGYPAELYALYLLRAGQGRGLGRALLAAVTDPAAGPMTALVLADNHRARHFYARCGARCIDRRPEHIGSVPIIEDVFAWDDPAQLKAGPGTTPPR